MQERLILAGPEELNGRQVAECRDAAARLAQVTGIDPTDMGGVGDSAGDIDFLRLVGRPAAPINATAGVKAVVKYVSTQPEGRGLQEILDYWSLP